MPPHLRQVAQNLQRIAGPLVGDAYRDRIDETELRRALLAGYPDRVARRRSGERVTLATGHGGMIGRESGVHDADWLIALDVTSGRVSATTEAIVRLASRIEPEWLSSTRSEVRVELNEETGAVKALEVDWYDAIPLREHPIAPSDDDRARVLAQAWLARDPDPRSLRLIRRLRFAGEAIDLRSVVETIARDSRRLDEVVVTEDQLPWEARESLRRLAPDRLTVPSGRDMTIEYGMEHGLRDSMERLDEVLEKLG